MKNKHTTFDTLKRREFTHGGLAAVMAAGVAPFLSQAMAQSSDKKKLGLAIVGLGGYATHNIAPEIASCQQVRLAAVVTGDPEGKGKQWAKQYQFEESSIYDYERFDEIAEDDTIDMVHIALPNSMHAEFAIRAAKAGKHVMVEKPMAISSEQCEAMIAAAKENGVLLGVNYRLHWEPHHVKAIELIKKGVCGDLACANYEFSWGYAGALLDPKRSKNIKQWLLDPAMAGGGALFDTGVYPIQAACYLSGSEPVSVRGLPATRHPQVFPKGIEETMTYELAFADGFQAVCRASYSHNYQQCLSLGTKGRVEVGKLSKTFTQSGRGKTSPKNVYSNGKDIICEDTLQQAVLLDAFATAIKNGDKAFKTSGEMGLRDIKIVEKIYESADKGGVLVKLD